MKEFLKQAYSDNAGGYSMQRIGTSVCLFAFLLLVGTVIYIALHTFSPVIVNNVPITPDTKVQDSLIYFGLGTLGLGLGIKAVQRFGEKSSETEAKLPEVKS
ncbi:MAG: hypothetical protein IAE90_07450 [Ignavibacteria bacterium]|nr:hypothetical protein [Ignavibacteria bacterium]